MSDTQRITRATTRDSARRAQSGSPSSSRRASISLQAAAGYNDEEKEEERAGALSPAPGDHASVQGINPVGEISAMRQQMADMVAMMQQQQQRHQQEITSLRQQLPPPQESHANASRASPALGATIPVNSSATSLQPPDWMIAMQLMQQQNSALQALGGLRSFDPKGSDSTLAAQEWLRQAEKYFASREEIMGINSSAGDRTRVLLATKALIGDAGLWLDSLRGAAQPTTWTAFVEAVRGRYCTVPDGRIRQARLQEFVDKAFAVREKLTVTGMQSITTKFDQMAAEVAVRYLTESNKLQMLARILPQRYAELVLREEAKETPPPMHEVITMVLSRAAAKEGSSGQSATSSTATINAVSLAMNHFGWGPEEAAGYLQDCEGWAPHDTDAPVGSAAGPAAAAATAQPQNPPAWVNQMQAQIAALSAKFGAAPKGHSQRRNVPSGVSEVVPAPLATGRKEAGLCIKCGVHKYEPGSKGHNSRTCQAKADITTTVPEGKKKAGF